MSQVSSLRRLGLWESFSVWLGLVAVLSALVVPASLLAEDVRTGRLGGLCSVNAPSAGGFDAEEGAVASAGSHCEGCFSLGLASATGPVCAWLQGATGEPAGRMDSSAVLAMHDHGLPFSRGPPVF